MNRHNVSSSRTLILLILSFVIIIGILEVEFTDYAMGQNTTGPGGIDPPPSDSATETTLATTTTSTSTFSSTKGGFHISTTITNTTTVIPVKP
jgi:hypothetical protein